MQYQNQHGRNQHRGTLNSSTCLDEDYHTALNPSINFTLTPNSINKRPSRNPTHSNRIKSDPSPLQSLHQPYHTIQSQTIHPSPPSPSTSITHPNLLHPSFTVSKNPQSQTPSSSAPSPPTLHFPHQQPSSTLLSSHPPVEPPPRPPAQPPPSHTPLHKQ